MDITNDASLDPFSIGPSTIVGRTIAFRVLFCRSMSELRQRLARFLRDAVLPAMSWFHPKNAQGILVMVTLMAFLLRRFTNVKSRAESAYRRKFWRSTMRSALTYEEWAHAAKMLDRETLKANESDLYDEELVRNKLAELRRRREEGSLRDVVFYMRADLVRNLGNMCNPELHKGRLQVPKLIKEYIDEVSTQLKMVCNTDSDELMMLEEKLAFMHETRHAFGRTALLLSGGASLGAFHVGVVKTLVKHKLLPRIIAGSSVGSIICAIVATRSWPELQSFFEDSLQSLQFFDKLGGIFQVVKRIMTRGAVHEIRQLQNLLRDLTSNLTFQEAYDMTGRILSVTVCSARKHEPPRCLNYLTSPHVLIWSAVTASCAFPGLFEAQELMAKDRFGKIVPFLAPFSVDSEQDSGTSARRWRDGSLESDLPMMQLKELFNVNHFIVSQANPHIVPLLRLKELIRAYGGNFAAKLAGLAEKEVKHRCNQILELGFPLGGIAKLFSQDWEGDVTVVMPATLSQYLRIIQNPSYLELQKATNQGRRCTWEKLSAMKANCAIELVLDECVALLNHMHRLNRSAERAAASQGYTNIGRFRPSRRIPSWNCIARENSSGSLDEDSLADAGLVGGPSKRSQRAQRIVHDSSESESESLDLNSWTRNGGPLMRTASANKFINFVQNLEVEAEFRTTSSREDEIDASVINSNSMVTEAVGRDPLHSSTKLVASDRSSENTDSESHEVSISRIMVSDGDFLQPERTHSGILLNIVKKDALIIQRNNEYEQPQGSSLEADVGTIQTEFCFDASSAFDDANDDDDDERTSNVDQVIDG